MDIVFEVTDPRGVVVNLTYKVRSHILAHHPEMEAFLGVVKDSIKDPTYINYEVDDKSINIYYHKLQGSRLYIRVVVKIKGKFGSIITCRAATNDKPGEINIWPV